MAYTYHPLPVDGYIRILNLHPSDTRDGAIKCDLQTVDLDGAECTYEAVSYVWGDASESVKITVVDTATGNETLLPITTSLHHALRTVRDAYKPRKLWVDGICIDQNNVEEKSRQVKRMGQVYEGAERVLCILGEDSKGIARDAFALIRAMTQYLDRRYGQNPFTFITGSVLINDPAEWCKVSELFRLPWFRRLWVAQEAALARRCTLLWGTEEIPIEDVLELILWSNQYAELRGLIRDCVGWLLAIFSDIYCTYRNVHTWRTSKPLLAAWSAHGTNTQVGNAIFLDVLDSGRTLEASDLRDHIWAMLGSSWVPKEKEQSLLVADYSKSTVQVYIETATALLKHQREGPWLLSRVMHGSAEFFREPLPTWVPQWHRPSTMIHFLDHPKLSYYRASGVEAHFEPEFRPGNVLALQGVIFDAVSWTSRPLWEENLSLNPNFWAGDLVRNKKPFIETVWNDLSSGEFSIPEAQLRSEFIMTLFRGLAPGQDHHVEDFEAYCSAAQKLANGAPIADAMSGKDSHTISAVESVLIQSAYTVLARTSHDRLGLLPLFSEAKDVFCIVLGMTTPLVLRPTEGGTYKLVGDSYVHGVMQGELMKSLAAKDLKVETVLIE